MSAAMSAMGERVTYGSFLTFTNNVLLLGKNTFHVLIIRSWSERLDHLVKSDRHLEAIELGIDYYQVWSLTQFYSIDFSKSWIDVKKCVFNKRTIKVCFSCF